MFKTSIYTLKALIVSVIFAAAITSIGHAQQDISIQSEIMSENREIVVHLPKDYAPNSETGYPVIYMLDAGSKDKFTAELASYYNWGEIMPKVIIVALKNVRRGIDFLPHYYSVERDGKQISGNGGKLLSYIQNELIPSVDKQFNTNDQKVFAGHSWAGQFLAYALSQSPGLFDAYFITSPDIGDGERWSAKTFDALKSALKQDHTFPKFIYVSVGGGEDKSLLADYYRLTALLKQYLPETVKLYHEIHDSAVHESNGAISIPKALQLYFTANTAPE